MKLIKIIILSVVGVFAALVIIGLLLPKSEIERMEKKRLEEEKAKELKANEANTTTEAPKPVDYILTKEDTTGDVHRIINKLGSLFMQNKLEEVIKIASANISRFEGIDRADLLNQRGGAYYALGQQEKALKDYEEAILSDPSNSSNITNLIETYASLGNKQKAMEYLNKLKKQPHPSAFDIQVSEEAIGRIK